MDDPDLDLGGHGIPGFAVCARGASRLQLQIFTPGSNHFVERSAFVCKFSWD